MRNHHHTDAGNAGRKGGHMPATITSRILCPCGCGEVVIMSDAGFSAVTVEVPACSKQRAHGFGSRTFRKSAALDFQPATPSALRHVDGLVTIAGAL